MSATLVLPYPPANNRYYRSVHARDDVPALVADNERLWQSLVDYGGHSEGCSGQYGPSYHCRCGWRDEARALGIGRWALAQRSTGA
jgi:hypothetical protein